MGIGYGTINCNVTTAHKRQAATNHVVRNWHGYKGTCNSEEVEEEESRTGWGNVRNGDWTQTVRDRAPAASVSNLECWKAWAGQWLWVRLYCKATALLLWLLEKLEKSGNRAELQLLVVLVIFVQGCNSAIEFKRIERLREETEMNVADTAEWYVLCRMRMYKGGNKSTV